MPKRKEHGVRFPDPDYVLRKGKYKGCKIRDVPEEYLEWMWDTKHWGWTINELDRRRKELEPNVDHEYEMWRNTHG